MEGSQSSKRIWTLALFGAQTQADLGTASRSSPSHVAETCVSPTLPTHADGCDGMKLSILDFLKYSEPLILRILLLI
jgi:hypothetical protein